jgi:DNA-directed RNA polymerase subunit RPC12/RpoP
MAKSKVVCPRCFSNDLYKFGKDKYGNQKYQCKKCRRQFAPKTLEEREPRERKYPSCPKCSKASFLYHDFEYYFNFRCCDKNCNHSFFIPKNKAIKPPSHKLSLPGRIDFKGMRYAPYIISSF